MVLGTEMLVQDYTNAARNLRQHTICHHVERSVPFIVPVRHDKLTDAQHTSQQETLLWREIMLKIIYRQHKPQHHHHVMFDSPVTPDSGSFSGANA